MATKSEIFGTPEQPTTDQLTQIKKIAAKLGDRAPSLKSNPPKTRNEAEAIINLYGRFV